MQCYFFRDCVNYEELENKTDIVSSATFAIAFVCFWYNVILLTGVTF